MPARRENGGNRSLLPPARHPAAVFVPATLPGSTPFAVRVGLLITPLAIIVGTLRLRGGGGLFGFFGWFWSLKLGVYRAGGSDPKLSAVVKLTHRTIAVAPGNPQRFVAEMDARRKRWRRAGREQATENQRSVAPVRISRRIFPSAPGSFWPNSSAMVGATSMLSIIPSCAPDLMPRPQAIKTPFICGFEAR